MVPQVVTPLPIELVLNNEIHQLHYPAWIFDEKTLRIVDANKQAMDFCNYAQHEVIGLSIMELWHDQDLLNILDDLIEQHHERSFSGYLRHKRMNGEMLVMKVRAVRVINSTSRWVVHLVKENAEC